MSFKLFISAMEEEIKPTLDFFQNNNYQIKIKFENDFSKLWFIKKDDVSILIGYSGIGKVNSSSFLILILTTYKIDLIISIGVCGLVSDKGKINDLIISTKFNYLDVDIQSFGYQKGQVPYLPPFYSTNAKLLINLKKISMRVYLFQHTLLKFLQKIIFS